VRANRSTRYHDRDTPVFCVRRQLVTYAQSGAIGKHASSNVHGEEFLEEEFCSVGDVDLGDAGLVVTRTAFVETLFELSAFES
jgi:hypothetical protein